jgi:hypothetical protein
MDLWHPFASLATMDGAHAIACAIVVAALLRAVFNK